MVVLRDPLRVLSDRPEIYFVHRTPIKWPPLRDGIATAELEQTWTSNRANRAMMVTAREAVHQFFAPPATGILCYAGLCHR